VLSLGLALEAPAELIGLVIGEVGAVALPLEAQTLLAGLDDLLVGDSELFGELVDAQHVSGLPRPGGWIGKGCRTPAYSPK
jgi:hypothetical protein